MPRPVEVKLIARADLMSPYSNHVIIERTNLGTYRLDGAATTDGHEVKRLSTPQVGKLEEAMSVARAWAEKNEVATIYLCLNDPE